MASNYEQLVEALRIVEKEQDCNECEAGRWHHDFNCCLFADAADAIEALQAEIRESMQKCAECGDRMVEPKRGEWINSKERMRPDMCSVCGCVYEADRFMDKIAWNYCPNCGAKMTEAQDGV